MEIIEANYVVSSPAFDQCPPPTRPEIAFIGRSNVGKSSVINMLTGQRQLAKTSATPGKTQLINHFEVRYREGKKEGRAFFVDLPGYGFAKRSQRDRRRWEQMIEGYIRKRANLVSIFVLVDSRQEPQPIDLEFIGRLGKWQTPFAIIFTKADKNKPAALERHVNQFMEKLGESWEQPPPIFISSAVSSEGKDEILNYIHKLCNSFAG
ncbi:MAG TPA: ribosome biogenesis GTP-binding protein YihA/YsxC [Chitinophagaceae bacterium]